MMVTLVMVFLAPLAPPGSFANAVVAKQISKKLRSFILLSLICVMNNNSVRLAFTPRRPPSVRSALT